MIFKQYNIEKTLYFVVMNLTNLEIECFLAICEHKTISRAAESLYITQPSLSSRLKTLERELGGELFVRKKGSRDITLTPAGKAFYKLALQYTELWSQMKGVFKTAPNRLRISSLNSLDTFLLPQVYDNFLLQNPDVELEIQSMDLSAASHSILSGDTDLAFTTGKSHDKSLNQTIILKEPMTIVFNKNLSLNSPANPQDLLAHQELFVDWSSDFTDWHNEIFGDSHPKLTVSIMSHIKMFLESKPCWAIVPVSVATGLEKDSNLISRLATDFDLPYRVVSIITLPDAAKNTAIDRFCDCLKQTVSKYTI